QPVLIVPFPNTPKYYVFTVDAAGGPNGFKYSIIDIRLNNDSGDVTQKNISIYPRVAEKLNGIEHTNGTDYWVMVHELASNAFRAYEVSSTGLNSTAVVSHVGAVHDSSAIGSSF